MKGNDRQLMRYFLLRLVLPFMVALSSYGIFRKRKYNIKLVATNVSPIFHLHCYRQFACIFTFNSDYFVKLQTLNCLR